MTMRIRIDEITCYGYHGALPEEQILGQEFLVDLELLIKDPLDNGERRDSLENTVDYREAVEIVCRIMEGRPRRLLETIAGEIAAETLNLYGVSAVRVRVCKPHPPIPTVKGGVSVEISREKDLW